jgi:acid phosphatase type 7
MQTQPGARRRHFGRVLPISDTPLVRRSPDATTQQPSQPLPQPTGPSPYHLSLDQVLTPAEMQTIQSSGRMVFHVVGDTGGIKTPQDQDLVVAQMEQDLAASNPTARPAFFYHLGDVVYYYGQASEYYSQFYEPYLHYNAPILAIPGNHDGDVVVSSVPSLAAFVENFCSTEPHLSSEAGDSGRDTMTQPNVYWTLETPFVTFIGLYTNVPEGGWMDNNQIAWLQSELTAAPLDKALIVSMHHPIYSVDLYHSGSTYMHDTLNQAILNSGRVPDVVFAGHVHNYQRFTRTLNGRAIPYIVAGAGGYYNLHTMQQVQGAPITTPYPLPNEEGVVLQSFCDDHHGYLLLKVDSQILSGQYFAVPTIKDPANTPVQQIDTFTLNLTTHQLQ